MVYRGTIYQSKNGTIITPYRKYQAKTLEHNTSIYDKVYHKSKETTGFYIDNYKSNTAFITHNMSTEILQSFFPNYKCEQLPIIPPKNIEFDFELNEDIKLKEIQGQMATQITQSKQYANEWFVNMQTGTGKTVLGVYMSALFHYKTMIVCFMTEILKQWKRTYDQKTSIDTDRILQITSSNQLERIRAGEFDINQYDIYLISPALVTSYLNRYDYADFTTIMTNLGIGTLVFDEAHRNMGAMIKINALSNVKYTIYLSADYGQGDYRKEEMYFKIFKNAIILKPDEDTAKSMKYTKTIVVDYDSLPSVNETAMIYNRYGFSAENYMAYQLKKKEIYRVIDHIMKLIIANRKSDYKTLILLNNIEHVDVIYQYLKSTITDPSLLIGRYHSKVPDEERDATLDYANVIISTYKSFGTGMDINDIKYVIGLNQSNKVEDNQAAGRARPLSDGSDAIYFIVTDIGFSYCKNKLRTRLIYLSDTKNNVPPFVYHM